MSREFYLPCAPYAYPECGSSEGGVVSSEVAGMDCMPLRPGPFHYPISEQAKSLVTLQNEVGALLEFRDLVIETFPNLRHKMAAAAAAAAAATAGTAVAASTSSSASSTTAVVTATSTSQTSSHIVPLPLSSPSSSRRRMGEWEPGKVRRRVAQSSRETAAESSSGSSLPRSRSNSHSGGGKNSATIQDSGFSTETSSKDSASTAIARPTSPRPVLDEAEDELWNLLDVIHRKGVRLREEVESLQGRLESVPPDEAYGLSGDVLEAVKSVARVDDDDDEPKRLIGLVIDDSQRRESVDEARVSVLRGEKEQLLDKVGRLEAENVSSCARALELETELATLSALRVNLEERLRLVMETSRDEIRATPSGQRKQRVVSLVQRESLDPASTKNGAVVESRRGSKQSAFANVNASATSKAHKNRFRTRTIEKNVLTNMAQQSAAATGPAVVEMDLLDPEAAVHRRRLRLGALDSVLVSPTRVAHTGNVDGVKIAAILREHSSLELQRHLITTTVHNQCLRNRLDEVEKSTETLSERLDRAREENDDLRFQLEERNIELEGTRARVRVLERLQHRPPTEAETTTTTTATITTSSTTEPGDDEPRCEPCCPEPGSSTESARDHHHHHYNSTNQVKPSPRKRPSRIPLPGTKPTAPKPPGSVGSGGGKNDARESLKSLKSLTSRPPRDSSRESNNTAKSSSLLSRGATPTTATSATRDSSRESLNRQSITKASGKEASRESLNRSLSRNNNANRDSINKASLSRNRDSLEHSNVTNSNNNNHNNNINNNSGGNNNNNNNNTTNASLYPPPGTPPRRPSAPARRSQSLARPSSADSNNDNGKVRTSKLPFWMSNWMK